MSIERKKALILYSKLSNYMLNIFQQWAHKSNVEIHLVYYPVDAEEAPYKHDKELDSISFYSYEELSTNKMLSMAGNINPDIIICSGWFSIKYLRVVFSYYKKIPTILTVDNYWLNTYKQKIAKLVFPYTISKMFSYVWVSGKPQKEYVKKLGFRDEQIRLGFYTANKRIFEIKNNNSSSQFRREFFFVGRYIQKKGILDLEKAFIEIQDEFPNEWKLNCIGHGPLQKDMVNHPKINHMGFVQPIELKKYISGGGVFVLPSHFEPWGLVVHEFSMAGFPLIVSDSVGAATQFIKNSNNGYIFKTKDIDDLKIKMLKIINSTDKELYDMSRESVIQSKLINEEMWIETIDTLLFDKNKT